MQAAVPLALATQAAAPIAQGIMANSQAKAAAKRDEVNAFIGRTRAIQTDAAARRGVADELGTMRSVFGANQDRPSVGTFELMQSLRDTRDRERRINVGNATAQANDFSMAAANKRAGGRASMIGGFVKAGPSLFDLYEYQRNR